MSYLRLIPIGIPLALIGLLVLLHFPALGFSWPIGELNRKHEFWGGLLVEMIGVAIEITLILVVLQGIENKRWERLRGEIERQILSNITYHIEMARISQGIVKGQKPTRMQVFKLANWQSNSLRQIDRHSDFLSISAYGIEPEVAMPIATYKSYHKSLAELLGRFDEILPNVNSKAPEMSPADVNRMLDLHKEVLTWIRYMKEEAILVCGDEHMPSNIIQGIPDEAHNAWEDYQ